MPDATFAPGTVWLVGAGPGDPDLLTRKAERLIRAASVVFHDALVGPGVLELVPRARAAGLGRQALGPPFEGPEDDRRADRRGRAGRRARGAAQGRRPVDLRPRDRGARAPAARPACRCASAPASPPPAPPRPASALSLTLRGLARRLTFVTAHARAGEELELDWQALADPQATLAIYMGKAAAPAVSARLIAAGPAGRHAGGAGRERQPARGAPLLDPARPAAARRAHRARRRAGGDPGRAQRGGARSRGRPAAVAASVAARPLTSGLRELQALQ